MARAFVVKCSIFPDERTEIVFDDGSSLIVHPNASLASYFDAEGVRQRLRTEHVSSQLREKVRKAFEVRNRYAWRPWWSKEVVERAGALVDLVQVREGAVMLLCDAFLQCSAMSLSVFAGVASHLQFRVAR